MTAFTPYELVHMGYDPERHYEGWAAMIPHEYGEWFLVSEVSEYIIYHEYRNPEITYGEFGSEPYAIMSHDITGPRGEYVHISNINFNLDTED